MTDRGAPLLRLIGLLLAASLVVSRVLAQNSDPKLDFIQALAGFSLALDGATGDEASRVRAGLDSMDRALARWDQSIRTAEAAIASEASRTDPATAAAMHATLGGAYLDRGRHADALREFTTAGQLDATRKDVPVARGLIFSQAPGLNDSGAATDASRQAAAIDPGNPVRWYTLARQLLDNGKPEDASKAFGALQKTWEQGAVGKGRSAIDPPFGRLALVQERSRVEPFFPPVAYADGFELLGRGDLAGAIAQFRGAIDRDPLTAHVVEPYEPMAQAAAAARDGQIKSAIARLKIAIELEPSRGEAHRALGEAYLKDEQFDQAIAELKVAANLAADDERTLLAVASAFVAAGKFPEAERAFRHVLEAAPGSGRAAYGLGRLQQRQGRYDDAITALGEAITRRPLLGLNGIYQSIGAMNAARQNFDAALAAYIQRVKVHPNDADAHQDLGDTYARLGRHDEARAEFVVALMLAAGRAEPYAAMAQIDLRDGRYAEAAEAARRALDLDASHAQARYTLGTALLRLGQADQGQRELEQFQKLQAAAADAHARELELGALRREASESSASGDHQQAVALFRKALELAPDSSVSHMNLGLALLYAGQPAEAVERFKSALALDAPADVHLHLARAYEALGRTADARGELDAYERLKQERIRRSAER